MKGYPRYFRFVFQKNSSIRRTNERKLGTQEARQAVDAVVAEHLAYFLAENPETSSLLVKKAVKAREAREVARKAREETRNGKKETFRNTAFWKINASSIKKP